MRAGRFIRLVGIVVALIWVVALAGVGYSIYAVATSQDWSGGIKPVIERAWCGKAGCIG